MKYLLLLLTLTVATSSAYAQKVKVQYDKTIDFAKFKTYSWSKGSGARNPLVNDMIRNEVEQELASRGLTKVDTGGDMRVLFFAAAEIGVTVDHGTWGNTPTNPIQTGIPTGGAWEVAKGSLAIDVLDSRSNNFVWRGLATDTLSHAPSMDMHKDAKRAEKPVKKAVAKLFKQFPRGKVQAG